MAEMFPVPEAAQVAPPAATHDQVTDESDAGIVSVTVAPVTEDGPEFVATMVYVIGSPGTAEADPSDFVMRRSAVGVSVSVSVAELFPGVGSVTPLGTVIVAVLTNVPVAEAETVAVNV